MQALLLIVKVLESMSMILNRGYEIALFMALCLSSCNFSHHNPTYATEIAPIIYKSCSPCHRPNQIGHFNLLSYQDVRLNAEKIVFTIHNNLMPPWPADPAYASFVGENILHKNEKDLIALWVKNGCPLGDSAQLPALPNFPVRSMIGKPDLEIPVKPIVIRGDFADQFLLVKVPFEIPNDTFIQTVEFVPGNTKVVHHVNGDMVTFDENKKKNIYDGSLVANLVWDSTIRQAYQKIGLLHDDGSYPLRMQSIVNYLPGVLAQPYPQGIGGWCVGKKNAFLLSDIHYGPSINDTWDSSYLNVFFAKSKPVRPLHEFQLGTLGVSPIVPPLVLLPNTISKHTSSYKLPYDISILTINPHMHLLGKSFKAYALTPNDDTIRLIKINRWDFNWQNFYTYKKMLKIPAGSIIHMEGIFDNTTENPFNPNNPPKIVSDKNGSMRTTDEMFQLIVTYLPYQLGDENISLDAK
jgi:hypothetical protein